MMDLKKLIDLLPYYFKENDTYKDSNGKGILERFLEICGGYFEDQVVSNTESLLENLDVEKCPEHFLQYFWEWFGCIPYAEGEFIDPNKWAQYYNGFDSKEEYEAKKYHWIYQNAKDPLNLSMDTKRRILKYAISLLKCRGSRIFFETMFRLYGIELYEDIINGIETGEVQDGTRDIIFDDQDYTQFDINHFDKERFCTQCIPVYFKIKYKGSGDKDSEEFRNFVNAVTNFINKYIPFNAHPIIKFYDGDTGSSIDYNKIFYIRVTNLVNGESILSSSRVDSEGTSKNNILTINPIIIGSTKIRYKVDVWSEEDPTGENSTWAFYDDLNIINWEGVVIGQQFKTNKQGIFTFTSEDSRRVIYNVQSLQALKAQDTNVQLIASVSILPGEDIKQPSYQYVRYEWLTKVVTQEGKEIYNPSSINVNDRFYIRTIKFSRNEQGVLEIDYKPAVEVIPVPLDTQMIVNLPSGEWREITNLVPGEYYLGIEGTNYGSWIKITEDSFNFLVTCTPDKQSVNFASEAERVLITIIPENVKEGTDAYNRAMNMINGKNVLYSKKDNLTFTYREGGYYYTSGRIKDFGIYDFTCTLNRANIREVQPYMGRFFINRASTFNTWANIDSITPNPLDLTPTDDNPNPNRILTIRVSKSTGLDSENIISGEIYVTVHCDLDKPNEYTYGDKWFNQYAGNRVRPGYYRFTGIQELQDINHGIFSLEVPFVQYEELGESGEKLRDNAYKGYLEIEFRYNSSNGIHISDPLDAYVTYNPSAIYTPEFISIIPKNLIERNWYDYNSGKEINWSQKYQGTPETENHPCVGQVIYQKTSDNSEAVFRIYGADLTSYTLVTEDGITTEVEDIDAKEIHLKEVGTYTFNTTFRENPLELPSEGNNWKDIIVVVKDFVPTTNISCYPTQEIIDNGPYQNGTIQEINLVLTPDNPRYSHKVVIFDGVYVNESGGLSFNEGVTPTSKIYEASMALTNIAILNKPGAVICWEGNFKTQRENYTLEDWVNNRKDDWVLGVNYCTYNFNDKNGLIHSIEVNPETDYINLEKSTASTTAILRDSSGNILSGDDYLIRAVYKFNLEGVSEVQEKTLIQASPFEFEIDFIPLDNKVEFYAEGNSELDPAVFNITDVKPKVGSIHIVTPDVTEVSPWTGPNELEFQILDSNGNNISNGQFTPAYLRSVLTVKDSQGKLYDPDAGYRIEKGSNSWILIFYNPPIWEATGSITISMEGSEGTWHYTSKEPVVPSELELYDLGVGQNETYIPGSWICKFKIKQSDGSYMSYSDFLLNGNKGILYINGKAITSIDYNPGETDYDHFYMESSSDGNGILYFNLSESPSQIYWEWNNLRSNTLTAEGEPEVTSYKTLGILVGAEASGVLGGNLNEMPWQFPDQGVRKEVTLPVWASPSTDNSGWLHGPFFICVLEVFTDGRFEARPTDTFEMISDNSEGFLLTTFDKPSPEAGMIAVVKDKPMNWGEEGGTFATLWDKALYISREYEFKVSGQSKGVLLVKASNEDQEPFTINDLIITFGVNSSFSGDHKDTFKYGITFDMDLQTKDGFSVSGTFQLSRKDDGSFESVTHEYTFDRQGSKFDFSILKSSVIHYLYSSGQNTQPETGCNFELQIESLNDTCEVITGGDNSPVAYLKPNDWYTTKEYPLVSDRNFSVEINKSGDIHLYLQLTLSN